MKIFHGVKLSYFAWWCQIVLFCMMVSNCPRCQIVLGVKLSSLPSWCQIVLLAIMVSNCPRCQIVLGVKLSSVSNGPRIFCSSIFWQFPMFFHNSEQTVEINPLIQHLQHQRNILQCVEICARKKAAHKRCLPKKQQ